ncbi:MAG: hypothetical protein KA124_05890 [Luteimonas sp.]|nr:hypothetical protein [Luteimonas sp.]
MNITPITTARPTPTPTARNAAPSRPQFDRRERDFGIGYGNSSGYASARRYTRDWGNARFRVA